MKYLILFCVGLTPTLSFSQIFKNFGLKGGVTYTKFEWEVRINSHEPGQLLTSDRNIGFNFFITSDLVNSRCWDLNSSLGILQKNGETHYPLFSNPGRTASKKYKLDYISWINIFRGKLAVSKGFFLTGQVGPRLEYLINDYDHLESYSPAPGGFFYQYEKDDIQLLTIGLSGGLGFLIDIKKLKVGLEGWKNINFNPITSAKGPRRDSLGDEGFYIKMKDKTLMLNMLVIYSL